MLTYDSDYIHITRAEDQDWDSRDGLAARIEFLEKDSMSEKVEEHEARNKKLEGKEMRLMQAEVLVRAFKGSHTHVQSVSGLLSFGLCSITRLDKGLRKELDRNRSATVSCFCPFYSVSNG